jgi:hypothetical protein
MTDRDAERHEVERIMRAAEALGHDPERVARALDHAPAEPVERQAIAQLKRPRVLARLLSRGFARRS